MNLVKNNNKIICRKGNISSYIHHLNIVVKLPKTKRYVDKRTSGAFKEIGSGRQMEMRQSSGPRGEPIGGHIGTLFLTKTHDWFHSL